MEKDTGAKIGELKVDGGACRDAFLMQFQADIMDGRILRPVIRETTALGAAYLAGIAVRFWGGLEEVRTKWRCDRTFSPGMGEEKRASLIAGWHKAVGRSLTWAADDA
jgi:glycerol kinase